MEELQNAIQNSVGIKLTEAELEGLLNRFKPDRVNGKFKTQEIVDYLQKIVSTSVKGKKHYNPLENSNSISNYDDIINLIGSKLSIKSANIRGDNKFQKASVILSENRSSDLTRAQLKSALQYRLALNFSDIQIDIIFRKLDPDCTGIIKVRQLASAITKIDSDTSQMSLTINRRTVTVPGQNANASTNIGSASGTLLSSGSGTANANGIPVSQRAHVSYDYAIKGLVPPDPSTCKKMHIPELERQIRDKLFEKSSLGANMIQTLVKTFGDSRDSSSQSQGITKDQLFYTIWNRFQMRVSENDLNSFYKKYDPSNQGYIPLQSFIEGVIAKHSLNEPLLEDHSSKKGTTYAKMNEKIGFSDIITKFLVFVRQMLSELTNRDSRAPHYLLHSVHRMTRDLTKTFFESKLNVKIEDPLLDILAEYFPSGNLIDVRQIIYQAMLKDDSAGPGASAPGKGHSLVNGAAVNIQEMPATLRNTTYTPRMIADMLCQKISERLKNHHPLTYLHTIFQEPGGNQDPRYVSKNKIRQVLGNYDIIISNEDFQNFTSKYDRGDGMVEIRPFLQNVINPPEKHENSFVPKSADDFLLQESISSAIEIATGHKRHVTYLNGAASTQLSGDVFGTKGFHDDTAIDFSINANNKNIVEVKRPQSAGVIKIKSGTNFHKPSQLLTTNNDSNSNLENQRSDMDSSIRRAIHFNDTVNRSERDDNSNASLVPESDHADVKALASSSTVVGHNNPSKLRPASAPAAAVRRIVVPTIKLMQEFDTSDTIKTNEKERELTLVTKPEVTATPANHNPAIKFDSSVPSPNSPRPSRPKTAPPSKSASPRANASSSSSTGSPRGSQVPHRVYDTWNSQSSSSSPSSPRSTKPRFDPATGELFSPRLDYPAFVSTGQPRSTYLNPFNGLLMLKYAHTKKMMSTTSTTNKEYGLHVIPYLQQLKIQQTLEKKQAFN